MAQHRSGDAPYASEGSAVPPPAYAPPLSSSTTAPPPPASLGASASLRTSMPSTLPPAYTVRPAATVLPAAGFSWTATPAALETKQGLGASGTTAKLGAVGPGGNAQWPEPMAIDSLPSAPPPVLFMPATLSFDAGPAFSPGRGSAAPVGLAPSASATPPSSGRSPSYSPGGPPLSSATPPKAARPGSAPAPTPAWPYTSPAAFDLNALSEAAAAARPEPQRPSEFVHSAEAPPLPPPTGPPASQPWTAPAPRDAAPTWTPRPHDPAPYSAAQPAPSPINLPYPADTPAAIPTPRRGTDATPPPYPADPVPSAPPLQRGGASPPSHPMPAPRARGAPDAALAGPAGGLSQMLPEARPQPSGRTRPYPDVPPPELPRPPPVAERAMDDGAGVGGYGNLDDTFDADRELALRLFEEEERQYNATLHLLQQIAAQDSGVAVSRDEAARLQAEEAARMRRVTAENDQIRDTEVRNAAVWYADRRLAQLLDSAENGTLATPELSYNLDGLHLNTPDRASQAIQQLACEHRWHWHREDDGEWQPFAVDVNDALEGAHLRFVATIGDEVVTLDGDLAAQLPTQPSSARFDLTARTQRDHPSGVTRSIQRFKCASLGRPAVRWSVQVNDGRYVPLDAQTDHRIETAFRAYVRGNPASAVLRGVTLPALARRPRAPQQQPDRPPATYAYDFAAGVQRNEQTGTLRVLQRTREDPSAPNGDEISIPLSVRGYQILAHTEADLLEPNEILDDLRLELNWMVRRAAGPAPAEPVLLTLLPTPPQIVLSVRGVARTVCGLLTARLLTKLREARIPPADGPVPIPPPAADGSRRVIDNPRLTQLLTSWVPIEDWRSRDDVMLLLAHAVIWRAKATVYGGFVRDWVIRGESANDIDVSLPSEDTTTVERVLRETARTLSLTVSDPRPKGAATTMAFQGRWAGHPQPIEVDLVGPNASHLRPFVDTDVGNLCVSAERLLDKKVPAAGEPILSLAECVRHCEQKRFVLLYNPDAVGPDLDVVRLRLRKYLARKWTCVSPLPAALRRELENQFDRTLLQPDPRYQRSWWA